MNGDLPRECISGARGAHIQENTMTPLGTLGAAAKLALLIILLQGVAVQAADIKVLSAGAARQPQRELNGTRSVLKFAPQSTRGEGRGTPCRGHARFNASGTGGRCGPSPSRPHGTRVRSLRGWDRPRTCRMRLRS